MFVVTCNAYRDWTSKLFLAVETHAAETVMSNIIATTKWAACWRCNSGRKKRFEPRGQSVQVAL